MDVDSTRGASAKPSAYQWKSVDDGTFIALHCRGGIAIDRRRAINRCFRGMVQKNLAVSYITLRIKGPRVQPKYLSLTFDSANHDQVGPFVDCNLRSHYRLVHHCSDIQFALAVDT